MLLNSNYHRSKQPFKRNISNCMNLTNIPFLKSHRVLHIIWFILYFWLIQSEIVRKRSLVEPIKTFNWQIHEIKSVVFDIWYFRLVRFKSGLTFKHKFVYEGNFELFKAVSFHYKFHHVCFEWILSKNFLVSFNDKISIEMTKKFAYTNVKYVQDIRAKFSMFYI